MKKIIFIIVLVLISLNCFSQFSENYRESPKFKCIDSIKPVSRNYLFNELYFDEKDSCLNKSKAALYLDTKIFIEYALKMGVNNDVEDMIEYKDVGTIVVFSKKTINQYYSYYYRTTFKVKDKKYRIVITDFSVLSRNSNSTSVVTKNTKLVETYKKIPFEELEIIFKENSEMLIKKYKHCICSKNLYSDENW